MSEVLVLAHEDVKRLLPMDECIELMAEALWRPSPAGGAGSRSLRRPSARGAEPDGPDAGAPLLAGAGLRLKTVCIFPGNPARGLDAHQGGVMLFDGETGELRRLIDASAVTSIRTAGCPP